MTEFGSMLQIYEEQNVMIDICILWVNELISRSSIIDLLVLSIDKLMLFYL